MADLPWTWLLIRASGVTAWILLTAVVTWGLLLRTKLMSRSSPADLMRAHRWWAVLALGALAIHMGLLLVDPYMRFSVGELLIPGLAPWKPWPVAAGVVAVWLLALPVVAYSLRARFGKVGNKLFKWSHKGAYAAWPLATAHFVLAGTDTGALRIGVIGAATGVAFLLIVRGWVPPLKRTRPRSGTA